MCVVESNCRDLFRSVVEGDSKRVEEDTPPVGHFMISGLRQLQRGVDVTLAIDASGILEVSVVKFSSPTLGSQICRAASTSNWTSTPVTSWRRQGWFLHFEFEEEISSLNHNFPTCGPCHTM